MIVINLVKVAGIWLCDWVNKLHYPFKKAQYSVSADLSVLEKVFYQQLETSFVSDGRFKYQLPMPEDEGDAALFQGLYVAMENFKYEQATPQTRAANMALGGFFRNGILIRGIRSDGTVNDTTSNDSATGVLLGLYSIWRKSTGEADAAVRAWATRIITSGYALTDLEGRPTKYGQLEQGWKTDPLRITLLLGIIRLAQQCSEGEDKEFFRSHYDRLYKKYGLLLRYPKVKLLWFDTDYDTHRAAIHLHVLYNLTGDVAYAEGMRRLIRITDAENNAWVQILCWPFGGINPDLGILHTFTYAHRLEGTIESINSGVDENGDGYVTKVKWGDKVRAEYALPFWRRGSQEFFWQRNMFSLDEWVGSKTPGAFHSGLDFLLAYWLAIRLKLLA